MSRTVVVGSIGAILGALAGAAVVGMPAARGAPVANGPVGAFVYFPRGEGQGPELVDTRNGAVYKRNLSSSSWELITKPVPTD